MTFSDGTSDASGVTQEAESPQQGDWLVEQRYRAVLEVLDGSPITEVAQRYGVSRQSVYTWKAKYAAGGFEGLREASRRPRTPSASSARSLPTAS